MQKKTLKKNFYQMFDRSYSIPYDFEDKNTKINGVDAETYTLLEKNLIDFTKTAEYGEKLVDFKRKLKGSRYEFLSNLCNKLSYRLIEPTRLEEFQQAKN